MSTYWLSYVRMTIVYDKSYCIDRPLVAAQTLSSSISSANTFLRSKATSDSVLLMKNLFDILNSFSKNFKAPMTKQNYEKVAKYLTEAALRS